VVSTLRLYYDAVIAVALIVAIICGLMTAVITGDNSPSLSIAAIAFLLTGAFSFFRLWREHRTATLPLG
jgi:uncharacterized oligopeptide transporter (OPT) family protein